MTANQVNSILENLLKASPGVNPYVLLPLTPEIYLGSSEAKATASIAMVAQEPIQINLVGLPGMGSTFLLHHLNTRRGLESAVSLQRPPYSLEPYQLFPILIELKKRPYLPGSPTEQMAPYEYILQRYLDAYASYYQYYQELRGQAGTADSRMLPKPVTGEELCQGGASIIEAINQHMEQLKRVLGIRPIFFFDNFDKILDDLNKDEAALNELENLLRIRSWSDKATMIFCSAVSLRQKKYRHESDLLGIFNVFWVKGLNEQEIERLLKEPMKGNAFPEQDEAEIKDWAGNHLALLILAARSFYDWRARLEILKGEQSLKDYPAELALLKKRVMEMFRPRFESYWDIFDDVQRRSLIQLASPPETPLTPAPDLIEYNLVQVDKSQWESDTSRGNNGVRYRLFSSLFTEFVLEQSTPSADNQVAILMDYLKNHAGQVCSYKDLGGVLWPEEKSLEEPTMRARLQNLTRRLKKEQPDFEKRLKNVRDKGYQLD